MITRYEYICIWKVISIQTRTYSFFYILSPLCRCCHCSIFNISSEYFFSCQKSSSMTDRNIRRICEVLMKRVGRWSTGFRQTTHLSRGITYHIDRASFHTARGGAHLCRPIFQFGLFELWGKTDWKYWKRFNEYAVALPLKVSISYTVECNCGQNTFLMIENGWRFLHRIHGWKHRKNRIQESKTYAETFESVFWVYKKNYLLV